MVSESPMEGVNPVGTDAWVFCTFTYAQARVWLTLLCY